MCQTDWSCESFARSLDFESQTTYSPLHSCSSWRRSQRDFPALGQRPKKRREGEEWTDWAFGEEQSVPEYP